MPHRPRPQVFQVTTHVTYPIPAKPGDFVVIRPGRQIEVLVVRGAQAHGHIGDWLDHLRTGVLTPCDGDVDAALHRLATPPAALPAVEGRVLSAAEATALSA
jgi:hypothetical protein